MQALQKLVGVKIRELREKQGLSQEALAAICSLHRTYIGLIERGERSLSLATIEAVANGLKIPVSEIFENLGPAHSTERRSVQIRDKSVTSLKGDDVNSHLVTIRQILIEAGITDAKRYEGLRKANSKPTRSRSMK
jgi:transcriptional regulator with XRE-family HTH domain